MVLWDTFIKLCSYILYLYCLIALRHGRYLLRADMEIFLRFSTKQTPRQGYHSRVQVFFFNQIYPDYFYETRVMAARLAPSCLHWQCSHRVFAENICVRCCTTAISHHDFLVRTSVRENLAESVRLRKYRQEYDNL